MLSCRLTVTGIDEAIRAADQAEKNLLEYTARELDWFGKTVSEEAKADHPYIDRTGQLTNSIGYTVESWQSRHIQVNVYATASYANEVEFGTSKSRAYPYLFPKFYAHIDELMQRLQDAANAAIADAGATAR